VIKKSLNRDSIKYFAMFAMLLNHIEFIFPRQNYVLGEFMRGIGYFTAISMCYFLVEGFYLTSSRKKYALRLFLFALLSQLPYQLAFTGGLLKFHGFNMLFSLLNCFILLVILDTTSSRWKRGGILFLSMCVGLLCDWSFMAPVFTFLFYVGKKNDTMQRNYCIALVFYAFVEYLNVNPSFTLSQQITGLLLHIIGPLLSAAAILFLYNGKRSETLRRFNQWFFYLFYPVHILILGIMKYGFVL